MFVIKILFKEIKSNMQRLVLTILLCITITHTFHIEQKAPQGIPLPLVIEVDGGVVI